MSPYYPSWGMSWLGSWGGSWGPIEVEEEPKTYYGGGGRYGHKRKDDLTTDHVREVYDFLERIKAKPGEPAHAREVLVTVDGKQVATQQAEPATAAADAGQRRSASMITNYLLFAALAEE